MAKKLIVVENNLVKKFVKLANEKGVEKIVVIDSTLGLKHITLVGHHSTLKKLILDFAMENR